MNLNEPLKPVLKTGLELVWYSWAKIIEVYKVYAHDTKTYKEWKKLLLKTDRLVSYFWKLDCEIVDRIIV